MSAMTAALAADRIAAARIPFILLAGGEPLARSDLWSIAERLTKKKSNVWLFTNGILMKESHLEDLDRSIDKIYFSVDGLEEFHAINRGHGSFSGTIKAIEMVRDAGIRSQICVFSVLNRENMSSLPDFLEWMKSIGVKKIRIQPNFMREELPDLHSTQDLFEKVQRVIQKHPGFFLGGTTYLREMMEYLRSRKLSECGADSFLHLAALPNGAVSLCCLHPVYIGNLVEEPLVAMLRKDFDQEEMQRALCQCSGCFRSDYSVMQRMIRTPAWNFRMRDALTFARYT